MIFAAQMATSEKFILTLLISFAVSLAAYLIAQPFSDGVNRDANQKVKKNHRNIEFPRLADWICYALILFFGTVLFLHAFFRYSAFLTGNGDVALFNQAIWNTLHGRPYQATAIVNRVSVFGTHFSPLLAMLVPLYAITSDLRVLAFVQALVMSAVAVPLYWYARTQIGHLLGIVLVIAYFLSPVLPSVNAYGFHDLLLAIVPVGFSAYLLLRKKYSAFLGIALIALLAREDVALVISSFGIYLVIIQRKTVLGVAVTGFAFAWVAIATQFVIPGFNPVEMWIGRTYAAFGTNFIEIVINVLTHPLYVFQYIFTSEKIIFLLYFLVPLALVPLAGIEVTGLAILPILTLLLSTKPTMQSFFNYYPSPILPLVFFGGIVGLRRILQSRPMLWLARGDAEQSVYRAKAALAALIFSSSAINFGLFTLPILSEGFNFAILTDHHSLVGLELARSIPYPAVVAAQDDLVARVSNRQRVYVFPAFPDYRQMDYLFGDTTRSWYQFHRDTWEELFNSGYFEIVSREDGYILAERRPLEQPLSIRFGNQIELQGYSIVPTGKLQGGQILRPILGWKALQKLTKHYLPRVELVDSRGHVWARNDPERPEAALLATEWGIGEEKRDQYSLRLPPTMPADDYTLVVGVYDSESGQNLPVDDSNQQVLEGGTAVAPLHIEKDKSNITAAQLQEKFPVEQVYFVDMNEIRLIGYSLISDQVVPGDTLQVGLYWRPRAKPQGDYAVSVELCDPSDKCVLQQSSRPAAGTYPTTEWAAGEVLLDWHDLALPSSSAIGEYTVRVTLSDTNNGRQLGAASIGAIRVVPR